MKKTLIYLFFLSTLHLFSQKGKTREFNIKSDNDLYSSRSKDRYYTNGLFLSYRYLRNTKKSYLEKKINHITIGQQLYSPKNATVVSSLDHDRPFAAYLFAEFGISYYYKNNSILKVDSQVGMIGPSALGKQVMSFAHELYGFDMAKGWRYQIADAFAINLKANFIKSFSKLTSKNLGVDLLSEINLGTIHTNINTGFNFKIGITPLKNNKQSLTYGGNLSFEETTKNECFFFMKPTINYVFYDATIQGSFLNNNSPITYEVKPVTFFSEFGFAYAIKQMNIGYSIILHTRKLKNPEVTNLNKYGSIFFSYLIN